MLLEPRNDRALRILDGEPVELTGIHQMRVLRLEVRLFERRMLVAVLRVDVRGMRGPRRDDTHDRQPEYFSKLKIAFVVAGHGHDRARAILHEYVVGDPDGDRLTRGRIDGVRAGEDAGLLAVDFARDKVLLGGRSPIDPDFLPLLIRDERVDERVLRCEHEVRRAEHRVGTRCEDTDVGCQCIQLRRRHHRVETDRRGASHLEQILDAKNNLGAVRAADPVSLSGLRTLRPVDPVEIREEALGVRCDSEEPLLEEALLDLRATTLARAGDHLLVREHGLVVRAPVHGRRPPIRQSALEQLEENPLRPLVILRISGRQLVPPIDHQPRALQLPAEVCDVARNQLARVNTDFECVILRVDAKCVKAHRLENRVPLKPLESSIDVIAREREKVADMQPFG